MKHTLIFKGAVAAALISLSALSANAQQLEEQTLKTNVAEISNSMSYLKSLKPITYQFDVKKFKHLKLPQYTQYGFLTAQTKTAFPDLVVEAVKPYNSGKNSTSVARYDEVQKDNLIPILVAAVKEQQEQIDRLKAELKQLKAKAK
ncbi:MAG: tail fiber domain-containing protein [Bacteroidota bacterium]